MFDRFSDYLFYLLPGALKKKANENQLFIFFKVVGNIAEKIKKDIFRLREQSLIEYAESVVLSNIYGQEREMPRMLGESEESYRKRLQMKADIAMLAGTEKGILLALRSVGYDKCTIVPLYKTDPNRWAEIDINLFCGDAEYEQYIDLPCIRYEVMQSKRASTLPHFRFLYTSECVETEKLEHPIMAMHYDIYELNLENILNGMWLLDGGVLLDAHLDYLNHGMICGYDIVDSEHLEGILKTEHDLWLLDGSVYLNGSRIIDAYIREEII